MRSQSSHSRKSVAILLWSILAVMVLFVLAGCSGGNNDSGDGQVLPEQTEIEKLKEENETLHKALEKVLADLEKAETKNAELEAEKLKADEQSKTDVAPETQEETPQAPAIQIDFVPPQRKPEELLAGEWYYLDFHEDGFFSWMQSMVFYADGTGTLNRTYYVPKAEAEEYPFSLEDLDISAEYTWNLSGDRLHIVANSGETVDYIFLVEQQQLLLETGNDIPDYGREKPSILEGYVERKLFAESNAVQAKKEFVTRSLLGTWYFDVLTWTFNDDGTGVIDIPKLGDQPATTREFSHSLTIDMDGTEVTYMCLMLDWPDGKTSYFYPAINDNGSIILESTGGAEAIRLTRTFDIDNCPMSEAIIANGIGVLSGSIFNDILP